MTFEIGQKVELNALGRTRIEGNGHRPKNRRKGEIVSISKAYKGSYRIKWETRKSVDQLHEDFLMDASGPVPLDDLKPCPFCRGEARTVAGGDRWYVTCTEAECFCSLGEIYDRDAMPDHHFQTEQDAVAAWNTRI